MIRLVLLAVALFFAIEGAIAAFWPAWAKRKMSDLQDVPDRTLGFVGFLFIVIGGVVAGLTEGLLQIACLAIALEGLLYGFLPMVMKKVMRYGVASGEAVVKVWGETALGIGAAGLVLFY
ncbi:MAG TPA: hypothetical protein DCS82_08865 [Rhodospirillaceae bacterium]|nr:hypothetical protein [Rhodospirillaceae bacterium]HAT35813.1 hypothetical protein [Rhodospirillaceae bacterium]